jgi:hypothetical protein
VNTNKAQEYEIPADWDVTLNGAEKRGYAVGWRAGVEAMRDAIQAIWPDAFVITKEATRLLSEGERKPE